MKRSRISLFLSAAIVAIVLVPSMVTALTVRGDYLWVQGPGCPQGWSDADLDDSHWTEVIYPNVYMWHRFWPLDSEARPMWGDVFNSCVRRHFSLPEAPSAATMKVWVDDDYELYINGKFVGKSADGWAEMPGETYDVSSLLKAGDNVIAMMLQDKVGEHAGALVALEIPGAPDEPPTWRSVIGPLRAVLKFTGILLAAVLAVVGLMWLRRRLAPAIARCPAPLLAAATIVVAILAQWSFIRRPLYDFILGQPLTDWYWPVIALALGMLALLAIMLAAQPVSPSIETAPRGEAFILLGILGLAAYLRIVNIGTVPAGFFQDEAINGLDSLRLYAIPDYELWSDSIGGRPTMFLYALGGALKYFGVSYLTLKIVPVTIGVASVAALYVVGRTALGPRAALWAAFLLAVARWHIHFSRMAWEVNCVPLFSALGFALLLWGFERRGRAILTITAAALVLASGLYTYAAYRAIAGVVAVFLLVTLLSSDRPVLFKKIWGLLLAGIAGAAFIFPLVKFAIDNPIMYWARYSDVSLTTYMSYHSTPMPWLHQMGKAMLSFNSRCDLDFFPYFDPVTAMLLLVGIASAVAAGRRRGLRLLWCWLLVFAALSSLTKDSPHATRMLGMLPPALIFAGYGAARLSGLLRDAFAPAIVRAGAVAALIGLTTGINAYWFFAEMQQVPEIDLRMNEGARQLCTRLAEKNGGTAFWTDEVAYNCKPQCKFLAAGTGVADPVTITEAELLDTKTLKEAKPPVTVIINNTTLERAGEKIPLDGNGDPILDLPARPSVMLTREGKPSYFIYEF